LRSQEFYIQKNLSEMWEWLEKIHEKIHMGIVLPYVWPQFTTPKLKSNLTWLLVGQPTFFIVAWTSLSSELVHATIKIVMAPYLVGPTFGFN
jgi:hypothetical protein